MDNTKFDSYSSLFPMPMTSIEKFHWFDDDPDFPNLIFCRLRFEGEKIDSSLAKQAWQIAIQRQPLADAEPAQVGSRWVWKNGPRGDGQRNESFETWNGTRFEWNEFQSEPPNWRFDEHQIRSKTGSCVSISVWPVKASSSTEEKKHPFVSDVWFYVHHAICDGAAAVLVINEWLIAYYNLCHDRPPGTGLHRLDPTLFPSRNSLGLLTWRYLKHLYKQPIALFGATKFVFRKTAELIPRTLRDSSPDLFSHPDSYPAVIGQWISKQRVEQINDQASSHGVMTNSILLGQLYLALAQWRASLDAHVDRDWIRVIVPMSIRQVSDRRLPACNRATIVQIDRCGKDMEDLDNLYKLLNREILIIRGWQLEKIFLIAIRGLSVFERLLIRGARNPKSRGMAVFTNLGEPLRTFERASKGKVGSGSTIRPSEIDCIGPIRAGTPVNFSVARYGDRMRISLHYDSQLLSAEQANSLLDTYVERLNAIE